MAQNLVVSLWAALKSAVANLFSTAPVVLGAILVLGGLWIALRRFDPERADALLDKWRDRRGLLAALYATAGAVAMGGFLLVLSARAVETREQTSRGATATRRRDPFLAPVNQSQPSFGIVREKTYTRTMQLPPGFLARIGTEGVGVLAPYLQDPTSENVMRLVDRFRQSGEDVIFTRELTRRDEEPLALDATRIRARFVRQGKGYEHRFTGEYDFANSLDESVDVRFTFPLPDHSGPVADFKMVVGDQAVVSPDEATGAYVWTGTMPPKSRLTARVEYTVSGSRDYRYFLGSDRRRTRQFAFEADSDRPPRFGRGGIYPTRQSLNGATWDLKDVLTSGAIELQFSTADARSEGYAKTLAWLPVVLGLFGLAAWAMFPSRSARATVGFAAGLLGVAVFGGYLTPVVATLGGLGLAALIGALTLRGPAGIALSVVVAGLGAAFLFVGDASLVAYLVAILAVGAFLLRQPRRAPTGVEMRGDRL